MKHPSLLGPLLILVLILGVEEPYGQTFTAQRFETFDTDPTWEGINNRTPVNNPTLVTQDFGFSSSDNAGGNSGEAGGQFWRTITPSYYGKAISPRSLEEPLTFSGQFRVTRQNGGGGVLIGFFNHLTMGWRPPSWLGFRFDDGVKIFVEYNTQTNQALGGASLPGEPSLSSSNVYTCTHTYDPNGSGGQGHVTFTLDGPEFGTPVVFSRQLEPGHKAEGANFTRFGFINLQRSGTDMDVFFDNLTINGETENFDTDPGWDESGNRETFPDLFLPAHNQFGFSQTNNAGGNGTGELGGLLWRTDENDPTAAGAYGDDSIGQLSMEDPLSASGKMKMTLGSPDSAAILGWYNSSGRGWPVQNCIGVVIEGPSSVGHYFRPFYGTSQQGEFQNAGDGPVVPLGAAALDWGIDYDPDANGGNGAVTATLDGEIKSIDLTPQHRQIGATFDRFGLFTFEFSGAHIELFFDDIEYTVEASSNDVENWEQLE